MEIKISNVNPNKLHDELIEVNIKPISIRHNTKEGQYIAENTWISFADDVDATKVNEIVNKHNPTPISQPTLEERNRADIDYILVMQGL